MVDSVAVSNDKDNTNIDLVKQAMAEAGSTIDVASAEASTSVARTRELTNQISRGIEQQAVAEQTVKKSELNGELQKQNANAAILQAAGGPTAQAATISELQAEEDRLDELGKKRTEIFERKHTGLSVVDLVINAFSSIPNSIATDNARRERNQTVTEISNISGAQESFTRVNAQTKQTLNDEVIKANLTSIGSQNTIEAAKQEIQNTHANAGALGRLVTMTNSQVSNRLQVARFDLEEEQQKIARTRQEIQLEELNQRREELKIRMPKMRAELERLELQLEEDKFVAPDKREAARTQFRETKRKLEDARLGAEEQVVMNQRGQAASSGVSESREVVLANMFKSGEVGRRYEAWRNVGASENANFGGSPSEAIETLQFVDPNGTAPRTKGIRLLDDIKIRQAQIYQEAAAKGLKTPNNPEQIAADLDATANQFMQTFASNIVTGQANPYSAPPMESLAPMLEGKGIALYDKVLKPMQMNEVDPQRILDAAIAGIQGNSLTPEQAAEGIKDVFEVAAVFNNSDFGGLTRVGLTPQTTYNTSVSFPLTVNQVTDAFIPFSGEETGPVGAIAGLLNTPSKIVDLMDIVQVEQLVIRNMTNSTPVNPATPTNTPNNPAPKTVQTPPATAASTQ